MAGTDRPHIFAAARPTRSHRSGLGHPMHVLRGGAQNGTRFCRQRNEPRTNAAKARYVNSLHPSGRLLHLSSRARGAARDPVAHGRADDRPTRSLTSRRCSRMARACPRSDEDRRRTRGSALRRIWHRGGRQESARLVRSRSRPGSVASTGAPVRFAPSAPSTRRDRDHERGRARI
jgi:hypothetical protein